MERKLERAAKAGGASCVCVCDWVCWCCAKFEESEGAGCVWGCWGCPKTDVEVFVWFGVCPNTDEVCVWFAS
jgi:hypothetical protein